MEWNPRTSSSLLGPWWRAIAALSGVLDVEASIAHNRNLALVALCLCAALMTDAAAIITQSVKR
jgi:hypothetical protein